MAVTRLDFIRDGACLFERAISSDHVQAMAGLADKALAAGPGARLDSVGRADGSEIFESIAAGLIGQAAKPVRAVVFDKTEERNWAVAWRQDRTIVVRERIEVAGFGPWSVKQGLLHVAPPPEVLASMATLRVHLDACGPDNAPLRAALGSHLFGRVAAQEAATRAEACEVITCLAEPGDVWAYSTPILHSSARAASPRRRRVLQIDYAAYDLPSGLAWRGLA